jgi:hypothetical protein
MRFVRKVDAKVEKRRLFPHPGFEDNLTEHVFFLILRCLSGEFLSRRGRPPVGSGRSWKEFFSPGTLHDGMGPKSGRNGTPVPQSRVSLSESKPGANVRLLEWARSFLLVSPDSQ